MAGELENRSSPAGETCCSATRRECPIRHPCQEFSLTVVPADDVILKTPFSLCIRRKQPSDVMIMSVFAVGRRTFFRMTRVTRGVGGWYGIPVRLLTSWLPPIRIYHDTLINKNSNPGLVLQNLHLLLIWGFPSSSIADEICYVRKRRPP